MFDKLNYYVMLVTSTLQKILKDVLKREMKNRGLRYNEGKLLTYENQFLGKITKDMSQTYNSLATDDDFRTVLVIADYKLYNSRLDKEFAFICQYT